MAIKELKSIKFPGLDDVYVIPESKIEVDAELSEASENPVQNKVIKEVIDDLTAQIADAGSIDIDLTGSNEGEANPINADTLGGIAAEEYVKKDELENIKPGLSIEKNYSVVGGMEEPSNPTENMIWVQTDIEIGKIYFSGIEPRNVNDNDIWISTSSNNSTVAFDSIRIGNDTMQTIYPISAKQYVNGAWVNKDVKSYQGGKWVDWLIYLYNSGDKCENITGGWTTYGIADTATSGAHPEITEQGDSVKIFLSGTIGEYGPKNKINLSDHDTLEIECTVSSTLSVRIFKDLPSNINSGFAIMQTVETGTTSIDISELNGEYYIFIVMYPNGSWMTLESLYLR